MSTSVPALLHSSSEPSLLTEQAEFGTPKGSTPTLSFRNTKRKRLESDNEVIASFMADMKQMMSDFQKELNEKYQKLFAMVDDFRSAVDFLLAKNESLQDRVNGLESEGKVNLQYIKTLESKLDGFERSARSTCLEVRNLPSSQTETKLSLVDAVLNVGKVLQVQIQPHEVKDVFRIRTKDPAQKTVIVDFTSVLLKEKIISKYKKCNRENNKLTTEKLRIPGPVKPIFISENLPAKAKKLFYQAREYAKENEFKFCWVSNGKIFLRKRDGGPLIRVGTESDLTKPTDTK